MTLDQLMFQLSLILFSVSSIFTVGMLIDRYPKIHRFGHSLSNINNLKVMLVSWPILICLTLVGLASFYFYSQSLQPESVSQPEWFPHLLFPIIYFLLPAMAERITTGSVILAASADFRDYCKCDKERFINARFSPGTRDKIKKSKAYPAYMVADSSIKFAGLLAAPFFYHCTGWSWLAPMGLLVWFAAGFVTEPIRDWLQNRSPKQTQEIS